MIELTVKTLDSQNHSFSVPDDITVKQLKEKIAESIPIAADVQRLIYCGRVLQDDRNLSEYDVNGKVIHLVQRPPPSTTRPNDTPASGTTTGNRRPHRIPRVDGNAMYLGAMAFPADLMDAQGIQPPQPSHGLSQSRLNLATRMLNRAKRVLDKLENPTSQESPEPESPPEEMENVPGANDNPAATLVSTTVGLDASAIGIETDAFNNSIAQAAQAATAAAIAAAVSAAQGARLPSVTIMHGRQQPPTATDTSSPQVNVTSEQSAPASEPAENNETNTDSNSTNEPDTDGASDRRRRRIPPRTIAMADTLEELHGVQNRLQPYLLQYTRLMREDPSFENDTSGVQDSQRVFNLVSEAMHNISHAFHALSDIMCDFNTTPPRSLRCRPVLIQHSAVLQAGIPIQAQFNLTASRGSNTTASSESQSETSGQSNASVNSDPQETAPQSSNAENGPQRAESRTSTTETEAPSSQGNQNSHTATGTRRIFAAGGGFPPAAFNISPGNVEVFMEVGPGSITIDSVEATIMGNNRNGDSAGSSGRQGVGMPWGAPPPPDFIQNIMQAVAGHMMGHAHVTEPSPVSSNSSTQSGSGTTPAPGQNSQARGNTATHPTTSTQTRSTSRPHVHFAPTAVQSLAATNFDPFLPCNSHHVKVSRRTRQRGTAPAFGRVSVDIQSRTVPAPSGSSRPPPPPPPPPQPPENSQDQQQTPSSRPQQARGRRDEAGPARSHTDFFRFMESMMGSFPPSGRAFMAALSSQNSGSRPNVFVFNASDDREGSEPRIDSVFSLGPSGRTAYGQSLTLADVLNCLSDHSYVEGESLLTDLIMTLARNMTFEDVMNLNVDSEARRNSLNRLRPHLRDFVTRQLLSGQAVTESNMSQGAERLVQELVPHFNPLQGARVRDDVDVVASLVRYHQRRIPEILTIITTEGTDENFGQSCISWCTQYAQQLVALIRHCCVDDEALEDTARTYMEQLTSGANSIVRQWTVLTSLTRFQGFVTHLNVPLDIISPFIVNRESNSAPPVSETVIPLPAPTNTTTNPANLEPMETEFQVQVSEATIDVYSEMSTPITNGVVEPESIPLDVPIGTESWHGEVPNDWVPVITRDIHTQRRQSPQQPFSDAYLSGMPPKRRKVITASKPQGNLTQIITETVRGAVEAGGISSVANTNDISEAAGNDPLVQAAYREQVRTIVEDSLKINPDFSAERFPNTAKFFNKK